MKKKNSEKPSSLSIYNYLAFKFGVTSFSISRKRSFNRLKLIGLSNTYSPLIPVKGQKGEGKVL